MSDSTPKHWIPESQDGDLFDRVIPEPRWALYAIHRLEFFERRDRFELDGEGED